MADSPMPIPEIEALKELARELKVNSCLRIHGPHENEPMSPEQIEQYAVGFESLIPQVERAMAEQRAEFENCRTAANALADELAALREPMVCGHPKTCWVEFEYTETGTEYDSAGYPVPVPVPAKGAHCVVCKWEEECG